MNPSTPRVGVLLLLLVVGTAASRRLARAMYARTIRAASGRAPPPAMLGPADAERTFDGQPVPAPVFLMHPHSDFAHRYWAEALNPGDTVVDATLGNGYDATFLALALGRVGGGRLVCMDVQPLALERSQSRMRDALEGESWAVTGGATPSEWCAVHESSDAELRVEWQLGCHAELLEEIGSRSVRLVVFNLGYLPGGDKALCTTSVSTVAALEAAERGIMIGGCVSVTIYPGHPEGLVEEESVLDHASRLTQGRWSVYYTQWLNQRNKRNGRRAPSLVLLQLLHD